jgi:hypothetical protein
VWFVDRLTTTAIIVVFIVKGREIDVAINEPMQCELERIGLQLLFEVNNHHCGLVITVLLEIWHLGIHISMPYFIKKRLFFGVFLQPQRSKQRRL